MGTPGSLPPSSTGSDSVDPLRLWVVLMLVPRKHGRMHVIKEGEEEAGKGVVTSEDLEGNKRQPRNRRSGDEAGRQRGKRMGTPRLPVGVG